MSSLPKVLVIMSTYNGEKFLREQIDSILAQENVSVTLHVSDDCSKDKTVDIVKEYQTKHKNIELYVNEKNKNFTYNFLDALFRFKDEKEYDFYAFADQDDYWLPDKLLTAVKQIEQTGKCAMYCSNLKVVDENLNYFGEVMLPLGYQKQHLDLICRNITTGCTIVMDDQFKNLATQHYPENIYLHDYWLAIIANFCRSAHFIYDKDPGHILYRQHGNNQIGKAGNIFRRAYKLMFKKLPENKKTSNLLNKFYGLYAKDIDADDCLIFENIQGLYKKKSRKYLAKHIKSNFEGRFKFKLFFKKY